MADRRCSVKNCSRIIVPGEERRRIRFCEEHISYREYYDQYKLLEHRLLGQLEYMERQLDKHAEFLDSIRHVFSRRIMLTYVKKLSIAIDATLQLARCLWGARVFFRVLVGVAQDAGHEKWEDQYRSLIKKCIPILESLRQKFPRQNLISPRSLSHWRALANGSKEPTNENCSIVDPDEARRAYNYFVELRPYPQRMRVIRNGVRRRFQSSEEREALLRAMAWLTALYRVQRRVYARVPAGIYLDPQTAEKARDVLNNYLDGATPEYEHYWDDYHDEFRLQEILDNRNEWEDDAADIAVRDLTWNQGDRRRLQAGLRALRAIVDHVESRE